MYSLYLYPFCNRDAYNLQCVASSNNHDELISQFEKFIENPLIQCVKNIPNNLQVFHVNNELNVAKKLSLNFVGCPHDCNNPLSDEDDIRTCSNEKHLYIFILSQVDDVTNILSLKNDLADCMI